MRLPAFVQDRLLVAYATGRLPSFAARRMGEAIERDAALASAYDALCRVERLSARPGAGVTRTQGDRLQHAILGATSISASISTTTTMASSRAPRAVASLGMAFAAAAVFFVVRGPSSDASDGPDASALVARGDSAHEPLGVKASCLGDGGARLVDSAVVGAGRNVDQLDCPSGSLLAFTTTNLGQDTRHLFIVGVTRSGERRWFEPFGPNASAVAVAAGSVDEPLSPVADTTGMPAEPVTLYVLIADRRVSAGDVERQLAAALDRGVAIGRLERLPLDVSVQARIELAP